MTEPPGGAVTAPSDAVETEVFRHLFTAVTEEMGAALRRAAPSPNIRERRDYSCAFLSPSGDPVALGDHMPVHLGALPMSVAATLVALGPLQEGDVALLNDPYEGGSHLPDLTVVAPVRGRDGTTALGYVSVRAHHADVGGMTPGSMPLAREIYQEGIRIPPVLLVRRGQRVTEVWRILLANVRTPEEREGDLAAQLGALSVGIRRIHELEARHGTPRLLAAQQRLMAHADRLVCAGIEALPDGSWEAEDILESDGFSDVPLPIRVRLSVAGDRLHLDFAGTAAQAEGGVNAVGAVTTSAARYVLRCVIEAVLGTPLPAGGGAMSAMRLDLPAGSLVAARPPAPVAAGNVETSQRITDVLLRAFGQAIPDRIPALSQGTMNNVAVGGIDPRSGQPFAYYETLGGGMGGGPEGAGLSGVHSHMSNTLNTPIEALEHAYPLRVLRHALRRGSGGRGRHAGGEGIEREMAFLTPADVTLLAERRRTGPSGHLGGGDGRPGEDSLVREGVASPLPSKVTFRAEAGDVLRVHTPGGGGWGRAPDEGSTPDGPGIDARTARDGV